MLKYFKYLLESLLLTVALVGVVWLIAWRVLDVKLYSVQTGSMSPAFSKGDLLINIRPQHLKSGDIVSYPSQIKPGEIVSHRIMSLDGASVITKGDNLSTADPHVPLGSVKGRAVAMIPKAGLLFDQLRKPAGLIAVVYTPALIITITELWLLTGRFKYRADRFTQSA